MMMFIKVKRDVTIKARGCADGRKQCKKYNNADVTSPTLSTEGLLMYVVINAYEERDVVVMDIPGACISADMDNDVFIIFHGTMAELMVAADPTIYRKYNSYTKK